MVEDKRLTIKEEIESLGIMPQYFETFYMQLKAQQQLPSEDSILSEQYQKVVGYLTQKKVLNEDKTLQIDGLKLFDSKKSLEDKLMLLPRRTPMILSDSTTSSGGGLLPCRRSGTNSGGGLLPCRG